MVTWEQMLEIQKKNRIMFGEFIVVLGYVLDEDPNSWTFGTDLDSADVDVLERLANGSQEYKQTDFFKSLQSDIEEIGSDYESFVAPVASILVRGLRHSQ